jgi:pyruvate/2-oxoglutarate dehydrogenase complex dihydrolipoamide dehydrogenase (E3) component
VARWVVRIIQRRRALKGWTRPRSFDRNLVVIGAGSAGLVTAYIAAAVKARVTLIEKNEMGGDCLNTGCVPSKALIRSAKYVSLIRRHEEFGVRQASSEHDFADIMDRVQGSSPPSSPMIRWSATKGWGWRSSRERHASPGPGPWR